MMLSTSRKEFCSFLSYFPFLCAANSLNPLPQPSVFFSFTFSLPYFYSWHHRFYLFSAAYTKLSRSLGLMRTVEDGGKRAVSGLPPPLPAAKIKDGQKWKILIAHVNFLSAVSLSLSLSCHRNWRVLSWLVLSVSMGVGDNLS